MWMFFSAKLKQGRVNKMKRLLLSALLILMCSQVSADPVSLTNQYLFRISTGPNSVNYPTYDTIALGAYADPTTGTKVVGNLGGTGPDVLLTKVGDVVGPNEYSVLLSYNTARTSPWTITATNGTNSSQLVTHSISGVAALPFVENVALSSSTGVLTPTISWTIPTTATNADAVRVGIYDDVTNQRIYHGTPMPLATTSFTVPNGLLSTSGSYAIRIFLDDQDVYGAVQSRSQTFVNFTPVATINPVILPSLTTDSNPSDNLGAPFLFNCTVKAGENVLIDPFVAVGYDFKIGANDPKFASVTLPVLGDNQYELWLFNGTDFVFDKNLTGGTLYSFGQSGVDFFRILGIEDSLGIDPNDVTAFITGLTFISDGRFTGSMTPIINQSVPEPAAVLLLGSGLIAIAGYGRKKLNK
jgi:hypothetical protein